MQCMQLQPAKLGAWNHKRLRIPLCHSCALGCQSQPAACLYVRPLRLLAATSRVVTAHRPGRGREITQKRHPSQATDSGSVWECRNDDFRGGVCLGLVKHRELFEGIEVLSYPIFKRMYLPCYTTRARCRVTVGCSRVRAIWQYEMCYKQLCIVP